MGLGEIESDVGTMLAKRVLEASSRSVPGWAVFEALEEVVGVALSSQRRVFVQIAATAKNRVVVGVGPAACAVIRGVDTFSAVLRACFALTAFKEEPVVASHALIISTSTTCTRLAVDVAELA